MNARTLFGLAAGLVAIGVILTPVGGQGKKDQPVSPPLNINPPHIATEKRIKYDYDIVYVRAPRHGEDKRTKWADFSDPTRMEPGADLMLLHPDGKEEVLVSGKDGSVMDPYVSFDGQWVYYAKFIDAQHSGADIWKIHVPTRKTARLTDQTFTPNSGAAPWAKDLRTPEKGKTSLNYGVYNLGPCPAPGGKVVFTSNRNAFVPPRGYPKITFQLFVMDDAPHPNPPPPGGREKEGDPLPQGERERNVEQIGHMNIACALHPVILKDGRIIFSTLESQGMHNAILWGIWSIHPDGTNWDPVVSAFATGGAPSGFHFQSQLSDETIVVEEYYNLNNSGFGVYFRLPPSVPKGQTAFGPGHLADPRNKRSEGWYKFQMPFTPHGLELMTRFTHGKDGPSPSSKPGEQVKARIHGGESYPHAVGKVTHPCGAPDNHLLTAWAPGPVNHQYNYHPYIDSGIYLIKEGKAIDEPGQMLLIKNDPKYNEQWPRALVPYKRIYGVEEPKRLVHENNGKLSKHLPEGTPFGLIGTSSLYKRESAPGGKVPPGSVTAVAPEIKPKSWSWSSWSLNWGLQGSDAGVYQNSDIHGIRIVAQEPRTDIGGRGHGAAPLYANHGLERLRILGEIPVRHFGEPGASAPGGQPSDPDGNPDTSFLAKIPADQPFTFQLIDKHGMTLTMAQTWHQLRPGEVRHNCGGCHAHSQQPTPFEKTVAGQQDYQPIDLTQKSPLLTSRERDESGKQWDSKNETGLRHAAGLLNVEYHRDVRPILQRSCVACHTQTWEKPAGGLILDDDDKGTIAAFGHDAGPDVKVPLTYFRLAGHARFKPRTGVTPGSATRYVTKFQSRRSLLVWKIFGQRLDGWSNDDFPSLADPNDPKSLHWQGQPIAGLDYTDQQKLSYWIRDHAIDQDYTGPMMPPPEAVQGTYKGPDGKLIKVASLSDEEKRTIVRWIDLGCPIDVDPQYRPTEPGSRSFGWMGDDQRPTLTLTSPQPGKNPPLTRILIGMHDAYTGLDRKTFSVTADFPIGGIAPGTDFASQLKVRSPGVWEWQLPAPIRQLNRGKVIVSVRDRQGNVSRIERTFSVAAESR